MTPPPLRTFDHLPRYKPAVEPVPSRANPASTFIRQRILRPPFDEIAMRFVGQGTFWMRLIPPHEDSKLTSSIYEFETYSLAWRAGIQIPEIAVPSSLLDAPKIADAIEIFRTFIQANYPTLLPNRAAETEEDRVKGLSLWPKSRGACLVYLHQTPNPIKATDFRLRIWIGSTYPGRAHNNEGILAHITRIQEERKMSPGSAPGPLVYGDLSHPDTGRLIGIETAVVADEFSFAPFTIDSNNFCPLDRIQQIFAAHPDFPKYNRPLEETIRVPTEDEILETLRKYIEHKVLRAHVERALVHEAYMQCFGERIPRSNIVPLPAIVLQKPMAKPGLTAEEAIPLVDDLPDDPMAAVVLPNAPATAETPPPRQESTPAATVSSTPPPKPAAPKAAGRKATTRKPPKEASGPAKMPNTKSDLFEALELAVAEHRSDDARAYATKLVRSFFNDLTLQEAELANRALV